MGEEARLAGQIAHLQHAVRAKHLPDAPPHIHAGVPTIRYEYAPRRVDEVVLSRHPMID